MAFFPPTVLFALGLVLALTWVNGSMEAAQRLLVFGLSYVEPPSDSLLAQMNDRADASIAAARATKSNKRRPAAKQKSVNLNLPVTMATIGSDFVSAVDRPFRFAVEQSVVFVTTFLIMYTLELLARWLTQVHTPAQYQVEFTPSAPYIGGICLLASTVELLLSVAQSDGGILSPPVRWATAAFVLSLLCALLALAPQNTALLQAQGRGHFLGGAEAAIYELAEQTDTALRARNLVPADTPLAKLLPMLCRVILAILLAVITFLFWQPAERYAQWLYARLTAERLRGGRREKVTLLLQPVLPLVSLVLCLSARWSAGRPASLMGVLGLYCMIVDVVARLSLTRARVQDSLNLAFTIIRAMLSASTGVNGHLLQRRVYTVQYYLYENVLQHCTPAVITLVSALLALSSRRNVLMFGLFHSFAVWSTASWFFTCMGSMALTFLRMQSGLSLGA